MKATISIITLDSGKPMSVNIYNQLPGGRLVDDMRLAGTPWGRVNRHDSTCKGAHEHVHVLWQTETGDLMRDMIYAPEYAGITGPEVDELLDAMFAKGLHRDRAAARAAGIDSHTQLHFGRDAITVRGVRFGGCAKLFSAPPEERDRDRIAELVAAPIDPFVDALNAPAYHDIWQQINALPLLFIGK